MTPDGKTRRWIATGVAVAAVALVVAWGILVLRARLSAGAGLHVATALVCLAVLARLVAWSRWTAGRRLERAGGSRAVVIVYVPGETPRTVLLPPGEHLAGRAPGCRVRLDGAEIHPRELVLAVDDRGRVATRSLREPGAESVPAPPGTRIELPRAALEVGHPRAVDGRGWWPGSIGPGGEATLLASAFGLLGLVAALGRSASSGPPVPVGPGLALALAVPVIGMAVGFFRRWRTREPTAEGDLLLAVAVLLAGLGMGVLLRLGPDLARRETIGSPLAMAGRQVVAAAVGLALLGWLADGRGRRLVRFLLRIPWVLVLGAASAVVTTALFGIEINGRRLWIGIGPVTIQTVEPVKIMVAFVLAAILADRAPFLRGDRHSRGLRLPWRHAGPLLLAVGVALVPLFFQGDLGPTLLLCLLAILLFVAAGGSAVVTMLGVAGVLAAAWLAWWIGVPSIVRTRVTMWLDPFGHSEAVARALWAQAAGGWTGLGLGQGRPATIPVVVSDFTWAAIVEEMGLLGGLVVLGAYGLVVRVAARVAERAIAPGERLAAVGLAGLIVLQAVLIVGGNMALLPLTGVTLPCVSFGGSALMAHLAMLALLAALAGAGWGDGGRELPPRVPGGRLKAAFAVLLGLLAGLALAGGHRSIWAADRLSETPYVDRDREHRIGRFADAGALVVEGDRVLLREDVAREAGFSPREIASVRQALPVLEAIDGRPVPFPGAFRIVDPHRTSGLVGARIGRILDRRGRVLAGPGPDGHGRIYPLGPATSHPLGIRSLAWGLRELERDLDPWLSGTARRNWWRVLRDLARKGRPGDDVVLTIDASVQEAAWKALGGRAGAVVALDPRTGELLALVSSPALDPGRASPADWRRAVREGWRGPLVDRCLERLYPPGSTFKVMLDAAWREEHPGESFRYECRGRHPRARIRELGRRPHGELGLSRALAVSCNVYFAELALRLGPDMLPVFRRLGFDDAWRLTPGGGVSARRCRVLRPGGDVPSAPWFERHPGLVGQAGIGQNLVEITPLHLAVAVGAIAAGGVLHPPHLVKEFRRRPAEDQPGSVRWIDRHRPDPGPARRVFSARTCGKVLEDMELVVREGTARRVRDPRFPVAGKTGTAQVGSGHGRREAPHAWFVGVAPPREPRAVVVVLVEHGGSGGTVAAPAARKVLEAALAAGGSGP